MRRIAPLILISIMSSIIYPIVASSQTSTHTTNLPGYIIALNLSINKFEKFLEMKGVRDSPYLSKAKEMLNKSINAYINGDYDSSKMYAIMGFKYISLAYKYVKPKITGNKTIPKHLVIKIIMNRTYKRLVSYIMHLEKTGKMKCNIRDIIIESGEDINESTIYRIKHRIYWCMWGGEDYKEFLIRHMLPDLGKYKGRYKINWTYKPIHWFRKGPHRLNMSMPVLVEKQAILRILYGLRTLYSIKGNETGVNIVGKAIELVKNGRIDEAKSLVSRLGVVGDDWVSNKIRVYLFVLRTLLR